MILFVPPGSWTRAMRDYNGRMATQTTQSLEEYLRHIPDPDVEYVDGRIKERPVVSPVHGLIQVETGIWFGQHREEWKLLSGVEVRTQVTATSVLLPDVVVHPMGDWPLTEPGPRRFTYPPLIVIEVLSIADSMAEMAEKCDAYAAMGIGNVWVIDPMRRNGRVWKKGEWCEVKRFTVQDTSIYLDLDWLFAQIDSFSA